MPGIGFVADAGHTLHICPIVDDAADCFLIQPRSSLGWEQLNVSRSEQDRLLQLLFRGDYANLLQGLDPPALAYWVQRADSTYRQDRGPITLIEAQSLLRDFDWTAELAYQRELAQADKDWCMPGIGFENAAGLLIVQPSNFGAFQSYFWNYGRSRLWGCDGLGPDEQGRILSLFYRGDLSLTRDWFEFAVETYTDEQGREVTRGKPAESDGWLRAVWHAKLKQSRARRGLSPELTEEERSLSEKEALALHLREARLEGEEERQRESIRRAYSTRRLFSVVAAASMLVASLLYTGILQPWLSESLTKDLWGPSIIGVCAGFIGGGLSHLELRALRDGSKSARRLSNAANIILGAFGGIVGVISFALLFVLAGMLLLLPGPSVVADRLDIAVATVSTMIVLAGLLGAYIGHRSSSGGEEEPDIMLDAGSFVFPFFHVAMGVFGLALVLLVSASSFQANWLPAEIVKAGAWLERNQSLALKIAVALTAGALAIGCWLRLKKNSFWTTQGLATALLALALLAIVQVIQMVMPSRERPYNGPTTITETFAPLGGNFYWLAVLDTGAGPSTIRFTAVAVNGLLALEMYPDFASAADMARKLRRSPVFELARRNLLASRTASG